MNPTHSILLTSKHTSRSEAPRPHNIELIAADSMRKTGSKAARPKVLHTHPERLPATVFRGGIDGQSDRIGLSRRILRSPSLSISTVVLRQPAAAAPARTAPPSKLVSPDAAYEQHAEIDPLQRLDYSIRLPTCYRQPRAETH